MVKIIEYFLATIKPNDLVNQLRIQNVDAVIDVRWSSWMPAYYKPDPLKQLIEANGMRFFRERLLGNPSYNRYEKKPYTKNGKTRYTKHSYPVDRVREGYRAWILESPKPRAVFDWWVDRLADCDETVCLLCSCYANENCHTGWLKEIFTEFIERNLNDPL